MQTKEEEVLCDAEGSRRRAAQAHMDWVDLSSKVIPPEVINQIRGKNARRFKVIPSRPRIVFRMPLAASA